jgi:hypothetical protein
MSILTVFLMLFFCKTRSNNTKRALRIFVSLLQAQYKMRKCYFIPTGADLQWPTVHGHKIGRDKLVRR